MSPSDIKAQLKISPTKRAFEKFKPWGLFSEFDDMRRARPCYFSRCLHEAAELTVRLRIFSGKRRRVAREEQPVIDGKREWGIAEGMFYWRFQTNVCIMRTRRKALDNIDLNQMSHRYVSGVLQNDWNDPVDFRSLDRSQRGCYIWVSLSYKTVNIVVSSSYH